MPLSSDETDLWRRSQRTMGIALLLVSGIAIAIPAALGIWSLSVLGALVAGLMLGVQRLRSDQARLAWLGGHFVLAGAVSLVAYACFVVGLPSVIAVYFSALIILGGSHTLGARAAVGWSVPCLMITVASATLPPETVREVNLTTTLLARSSTLLTVLAFSVSFRIHQDRQTEELAKLALTDSLTGLANRREFERALEEATSRASRFGRQCAALFIDLDGMKRVNDEQGHAAGDRLLVEVAERIRATTRRIDTVARLGGDEFVIVLSEVTGREGVEAFAQQMLQRVSEPMLLDDSETTPSLSVGAALYPDASDSCKTLLRLADEAMYAAKQAGGDCIYFHDGTSPVSAL